MKNSPEQGQGSTYMSGQTAQEVQNGRVRIRESRSGSEEAATATVAAPTKPRADRPGGLDVELPGSTADLPDVVSHRDGRRRTVIVAVLGVLALLVTLGLVAVSSSSTEPEVGPATATYTGDWKDGLTERRESQPYTGDWKDVLVERNGSQPYTGDWKDGLTERGRSARANEAATARLQGHADQYEVARNARANRAATARLQGAADQHLRHVPDLSVEPAG